jgi:hypothetical protein
VRLSPLGTSATNWPVVPAPDDRWWVWSSRWNENWQGKPKYSEKTYPSAILSTTNPTWHDLGSNSGRRGGKPATNRLSYGTAFDVFLTSGSGRSCACISVSDWIIEEKRTRVFLAHDCDSQFMIMQVSTVTLLMNLYNIPSSCVIVIR